MEEIFIRIMGLVSQRSKIKLFGNSKVKKPGPQELSIFLDYSYFEVPIGFEFNYLLEPPDAALSNKLNKAIIRSVTQGLGVDFQLGIPKGHQTICNIELDVESRTMIESKIAEVDAWELLGKTYLLSNVNNSHWMKYYTQQ